MDWTACGEVSKMEEGSPCNSSSVDLLHSLFMGSGLPEEGSMTSFI